MPPRIPIGIDDFRALRELELEYVDKSNLIRELIDERGVQVVLFPRPRRFGKTLNLSMLRCFFEKSETNLSHLFQDLAIWQAGDAYRAQFQRYPVIHFSFKGTRADSFEASWVAIREKIVDSFDQHRGLLDSGILTAAESWRFRAILDRTAEQALYERALLDLSAILHRHHGEKVVVLIDEYDEPIHSGYTGGYAPQILGFVRNFFMEGLKSNPHLHRAVLTGILRIARENLFSGANNFGLFSLLARRFNTCFGFTEPEVVALLERASLSSQLPAVRAWYNGYLFGNEVVYNPWSVMSYLQRGEDRPAPYWLSTSSNDLVREVLESNALRLEPIFESLLEGGSFERVLDESVVLADVATNEDALWSLLVFSGYLKAESIPGDPMDRAHHRLSIPNREVREIYATTFKRWMRARMEGHGGSVAKLTQALLGGDAESFEEQLQAFVTDVMSTHDAAGLDPERVYQGFVIGLLAVLEPEYLVRSNRESGRGRPDVLIRAREAGKPAAVLELKLARKGRKTPAAALREGLAEIDEGDYAAELRASGASAVHAFAVAFDGKRVWVKSAVPAGTKRLAKKKMPAPARKGSNKKAPAPARKGSKKRH